MRDGERLVDVVGEDAGGEPEARLVRALDGLFDRLELEDALHRTEDLLARDRHLVLDAREHSRLHVVACERECKRRFINLQNDHSEYCARAHPCRRCARRR